NKEAKERESAIKKRIAHIRARMEATESEDDKEKFSERLAKLTGGVAIIRVGGATEAEMKQTKGRVEDAPHATRAAVAEGIVPGGVGCYPSSFKGQPGLRHPLPNHEPKTDLMALCLTSGTRWR